MTITNNAAYEIPGFKVGVIEANLDLSAAQYCAVKVIPASGSGLLGLSALALASAGGNIFGILQNNPLIAEAGEVMCKGVSKAIAGGTFAAGDLLMSDASGHLVLATSTNNAVAQALQPGVSGRVVSVNLDSYGVQP